MTASQVGILLFVLLSSIVLAMLATLSIKALVRERKLKKFMGDRKGEYTWQDKLLDFFRQLTQTKNHELKQKFIAAGFYDEGIAEFYFPLKYGCFAICAIAVFFFQHELGIAKVLDLVIWVASLAIFFIIIPDVYLSQKKAQLTRKLSQELPYFIDLLGVCVQTGMTIEASFIYITKEVAVFDKDLAYMIKKTTDRSKIVGLPKALNELLERVPSNEMRSFVSTINQSLQYGTSIYDVLLTLAKDIRELQMLTLEEKVGKLSAKMSIPLILFIMLPIVILVAGPGVMRLFYYGFQ